MKKSSTVAMERIQIFEEHQRTIGLDLGNRTSHYCILNEAGQGLCPSNTVQDLLCGGFLVDARIC